MMNLSEKQHAFNSQLSRQLAIWQDTLYKLNRSVDFNATDATLQLAPPIDGELRFTPDRDTDVESTFKFSFVQEGMRQIINEHRIEILERATQVCEEEIRAAGLPLPVMSGEFDNDKPSRDYYLRHLEMKQSRQEDIESPVSAADGDPEAAQGKYDGATDERPLPSEVIDLHNLLQQLIPDNGQFYTNTYKLNQLSRSDVQHLNDVLHDQITNHPDELLSELDDVPILKDWGIIGELSDLETRSVDQDSISSRLNKLHNRLDYIVGLEQHPNRINNWSISVLTPEQIDKALNAAEDRDISTLMEMNILEKGVEYVEY